MKPPLLARVLLRRLGRAGRRDEIEADLLELFRRRVAANGRLYAWRRYWIDVVSLAMRHGDRRRAGREGRERPRRHGYGTGVRRTASASRGAADAIVLRHRRRDAGGRLQRALRRVHHRRSPAARVTAARFATRIRSGACTSSAPTSAVDGSSGTRIPTRSTRTCARISIHAISRAAYRLSRTSLGAGLDARQVSVAFADGDYFRDSWCLRGDRSRPDPGGRSRAFGPAGDRAQRQFLASRVRRRSERARTRRSSSG